MYTQSYEFINNLKIISGNKALENIPMELKCYDSRREFLFTSRKIEESPVKKKFIRAFADSDTTRRDPGQFCNPEDLDYNEYHMVLQYAYTGSPVNRTRIKRGKIKY